MPYYASGSHGRGCPIQKTERPKKKEKKKDPEKPVEKKTRKVPPADHS